MFSTPSRGSHARLLKPATASASNGWYGEPRRPGTDAGTHRGLARASGRGTKVVQGRPFDSQGRPRGRVGRRVALRPVLAGRGAVAARGLADRAVAQPGLFPRVLGPGGAERAVA